MALYHVEIVTPVALEFDAIRAKNGRAAIEKALAAAGYTGAAFAWYQGTGLSYPAGKRPTECKYQVNGEFVHGIAWTL